MMAHKIEEHDCFDVLVKESGSDATFVKVTSWNLKDGTTRGEWVINLFQYTPSLGISTRKGKLVPNFCPICGEDFREGVAR